MKQRITIRDLNKLTDGQKQQLREWWKPQVGDFYAWHCIGIKTEGEHLATDAIGPWADEEAGQYAIPLVSIGQMIEFIQEKKPLLKSIGKARFDKWIVNIETATLGYKDELCDALWEATTRVLKDVE